jgi:hypothetical protein
MHAGLRVKSVRYYHPILTKTEKYMLLKLPSIKIHDSRFRGSRRYGQRDKANLVSALQGYEYAYKEENIKRLGLRLPAESVPVLNLVYNDTVWTQATNKISSCSSPIAAPFLFIFHIHSPTCHSTL